MRRVSFLAPRGALTAELVANALDLIGVEPDPNQLADLSDLELLMTYDYAMRLHYRASDHKVQLRPRPSFLRSRRPVVPTT